MLFLLSQIENFCKTCTQVCCIFIVLYTIQHVSTSFTTALYDNKRVSFLHYLYVNFLHCRHAQDHLLPRATVIFIRNSLCKILQTTLCTHSKVLMKLRFQICKQFSFMRTNKQTNKQTNMHGIYTYIWHNDYMLNLY